MRAVLYRNSCDKKSVVSDITYDTAVGDELVLHKCQLYGLSVRILVGMCKQNFILRSNTTSSNDISINW